MTHIPTAHIFEDSQPQPELRMLWLEITLRCNFACVHCNNESGAHRTLMMPEAMCVDALQQAQELGCRFVQFIGGEITLHPQLELFIETAHAKGFSVEAFTNAARITDHLFEVIKRCQIRIATSFYSDDEETHDRVTKTPGSHRRTLANIRRFVAEGIPLRVGVIETNENVGGGEKTITFLKELGVEHVGFDKMRPFGRGDFLGSERQSPCDGLCGRCADKKICITATGEVLPCTMGRDPALHLGVFSDGIASIVRGTRKDVVRQRIVEHVGHGKMTCDPDHDNCYPNQACNPELNCQQDCYPDVMCAPGWDP